MSVGPDPTTGLGRFRSIAKYLAEHPQQVVPRDEVRASLGAGYIVKPTSIITALNRTARGTAQGRNRVTTGFQEALRRFEKAGWIERRELTIKVLDRKALMDYANGAELP